MTDLNQAMPSVSRTISRRQTLRALSVGAVGLTAVSIGGPLMTNGWESREPTDPLAVDPRSLSPDECLRLLEQGNARFAAGESIAPHRDSARLREVAPRQTPFAAFLGCADSRVPVEIIFDQGFGDLFVTRIAGNVATSENIGSLEFGSLVLGCKVIYVLGHTSCGAVSAAMKREPVPGQISGLFQHLHPAVRASGHDLNRAIEENVRIQAQVIAEASPVISDLIRHGKVIVAGGIYDLETGAVRPVRMRAFEAD